MNSEKPATLDDMYPIVFFAWDTLAIHFVCSGVRNTPHANSDAHTSEVRDDEGESEVAFVVPVEG